MFFEPVVAAAAATIPRHTKARWICLKEFTSRVEAQPGATPAILVGTAAGKQFTLSKVLLCSGRSGAWVHGGSSSVRQTLSQLLNRFVSASPLLLLPSSPVAASFAC